ncbi:MAG: ribonuclease R [Thermodesulfobacteriota bacterium]
MSKCKNISDSAVLSFIKEMNDKLSKPVSMSELIKAFCVPAEKKGKFKARIHRMLSEGVLVRVRGGRYGLAARMNLVTGVLQCHADGFGFVIPERKDGGGATETDVFIGRRRFSGAMHGDTVVARVEGQKEGGRREGRIIRVLQRANKTLVGRLHREANICELVASEERIIDRIIIPAGCESKAADGVMVEVEITRWPTKHSSAAGKVIEILGDPDDPDVEAGIILKKYGLSPRFPRSVMEEARAAAASVMEAEAEGRMDLRTRTIVTIDGETAKDFDDAVGIERSADGGYRLFVSIADVSHYVREGTQLDSEAERRGTSVYFPDRCVPMLPEALSNGICSLRPDEDRLTMTAEMVFNAGGTVTGSKFYKSIIRSKRRLTYTEVKTALEGGAGDGDRGEKATDEVLEDLRLMRELAEKLTKNRVATGSIDFDLPEPQIIIDINGRVEDIVRSERNIAHRIVEEFMLAANRCVAEEFRKGKLPFLYRVHDVPAEESIESFREFIAEFGLTLEKDAKGGPCFAAVLAAVEGRPEAKLITHMLLRSMKQAVYSDSPIGHFGLGFRDYTHFTSPIRRYPDLVVHRLLKLLISGKYSAHEQDRMAAILPETAALSSARERKAMEAEREVVDLKKVQFMQDKTGEEYAGIVSGVTSFGFFVELEEYFVEGLVHVSSLLNDYYVFDEKKHILRGEKTKEAFRVGVSVKVRIEKVDLGRRRIDLALVTDKKNGSSRGKAGKGGGRRRGGGRGRRRK